MQGKADRTIVYQPNHQIRGSISPLGRGKLKASIHRDASTPSATMTQIPANQIKSKQGRINGYRIWRRMES